jgi:hypothetical protein
VGSATITAIARVGRLKEPVRVQWSHHGLVDPNADRPQDARLSKALIQEATDKALQRTKRGAFDLLLDDLHEARKRAARRPMRKAIVFCRRGGLASGQRVFFVKGTV